MTLKFKTKSALLNVTTGRRALAKHLDGDKIVVVAEMEIDRVWSEDDGKSQMFACKVKSVKQI